MKRIPIILLLLLFLVVAESCLTASSNKNLPVIVSVETDKDIYSEGEPVVITIIASNPNDEPVTLVFPMLAYPGLMNVNYLINDDFNYWIDMNVIGLTVMVYVTIEPYGQDSAEIVHQPDHYYLVAGTHTVTGIVDGYGEASENITVNPVTVEDEFFEKQSPRQITVNNYPNPFNPETVISFRLPEEGRARITIFNARGEIVRTLTDEFYTRGEHRVVWNGKNDQGMALPSGVYYYRLSHPKGVLTSKMLLLK